MSTSTLTNLQRSVCERAQTVDVRVHAPLASRSREGYRRWLCDLYRFIAPFETSFRFTPGLYRGFVQARLKAGRLSADLMALGLGDSERVRLAKRCVVPQFGDPTSALGWLFVVDRLTLQLESIRDGLVPALSIELEAAGAFFAVYDGAVLEAWSHLGRSLDGCVHDAGGMKTLEAAARDALDCLETCVLDSSTAHAITDRRSRTSRREHGAREPNPQNRSMVNK